MGRTFTDSLDSDLENVFFNVNELASAVTLKGQNEDTTDVPAMTVTRTYEVADNAGNFLAVTSIDFDIVATKYVIDGEQTDPKPNHRLVDSLGAVYEVMPIAGSQCFSASEDGKILTVHTKRMKCP